MSPMKTYHWFFLVIAILMWNGMLIKRDQNMFDGYDKMNAKEHYCSQLKVWHPDCKIE
jgi:hypothetical protein